MTSDFHASEADKLTRAMLCVYAVYAIYTVGKYLFQIDGLRVGTGGAPLGSDFINFWAGGYQTLAGQVEILYNSDAHMAFLLGKFGEPLGYYAFSYPPHILPFLTVLGALPYPLALFLWSALGLVAFGLAGRSFSLSRNHMLVLLAAPATLICLKSGQTGLWTAALLIGGLSQMEKRPILAGVIFGILTVKPQMGVLLAAALLTGGYWRTIISASLTLAGLLGLSYLWFGMDPWYSFVSETLPYQSQIIAHSIGSFDHMVQTPFKYIINLGGPIALAYALQAVYMIAGLIATVWVFRQPVDMALKAAVLCIATLLFSPYMAIYDMPILMFAILVYAKFRREDLTVPMTAFLILAAALPIIGPIASHLNIPLSITVLPILAYLTMMEVRGSVPL